MMTIVYLIGFIIVIKFAHSLYKGQSVDIKQIPVNSDKKVDIIDSTSSIEVSVEVSVEIPTEVPKSLGKNKFLYPDDEFISHKKVKKYKPKNYDINR